MSVSLNVDLEALKPILRETVKEVMAQVDSERSELADRLAFSEGEAARMLGFAPHQLRDERMKGRIKASVGPGGRVLYSRAQLLAYLDGRDWDTHKRRRTTLRAVGG